MPHRASADPVKEAASYFTIGSGLAAIATGTTGGGAPAMATGGMLNAVGGTRRPEWAGGRFLRSCPYVRQELQIIP
jgi:hypothetical protein